MSDVKILRFRYRNHRGEVADRRVKPVGLWWGKTEWHPEEQWLLNGVDDEKGEVRDFAVRDILSFRDGRDPRRTTHDLKTLPVHFRAIKDGRKTFELRRDDRGFREGDTLHLREYDPHLAAPYTGNTLDVVVTYVTTAGCLEADHVAMAIRPA